MPSDTPLPVTPAPVHRPLAAALFMTGSIVSFTAMAVAGRVLGSEHDTFEIMTWRSAIGLMIVLAIGAALGRLGEIRRGRLGQHVARNTVHFIGQNLWFYAITLIPLAQVFALEFTSPLWVILLSPLFLGERLTRRKGVAAALGFGGILLVVRPDFGGLTPGVIAGASAAVCFAATVMLTKALTRGESIVSILFWLTLIQLILGLITAGHDGEMRLPTATTLPWLALVGAGGLLAHYCLTMALSLAPASMVAPMDFLRLPVIALIGASFFGEAIDALVLVGAVLIFAGNWINLRSPGPRASRPA